MYPHEVKEKALALVDAGHNDCDVARRLGLPRSTVRDYAELLGLYLGDGYIVRTGRSDRLRLFLDTKYEQILADAEALLRRCFPLHRVGRFTTRKGTTTILSVYFTHLACLFPQHGAGMKHQRDIVLEDWQTEIVASRPWELLRGLIRSDGCVFVNRTGRYEYLSYEFSNRSQQIRELFMDACDRVDVQYRPYARYVRIYRRESVALMQEHVGGKA